MRILLLLSFLYFNSILFAQPFADSLSINPNPFSKRTAINYSFSSNDTVTIAVMNSIGQFILTLFTDSVMPAGMYQDSLIMDSFPDGIYFVQLKLGNRKTINKKVIKVLGTSFEEYKEESTIMIFPNPTSGRINFDFQNKNRRRLNVFITNSIGQEVYFSNILSFSSEIDLSFLNQGIYLVRLEDNGTQKMFKIFKE